MADRVSASITIGGTLPADLLPDLLAAIECEGLSTEWDGPPFAADQLPADGPLALMAHEVAWGCFRELEAFCVENRLPFARWSGSYAGQWGAERTVFTGASEPRCFAADEDDYALIGRCTAERLPIETRCTCALPPIDQVPRPRPSQVPLNARRRRLRFLHITLSAPHRAQGAEISSTEPSLGRRVAVAHAFEEVLR